MWPFEDKRLRDELSNLKNVLQNSFTNVKNDTSSIFHWVNYLQQYNELLQKRADETEKKLNEVLHRLDTIPTSPEQLRSLIDQYYSHSHTSERIDAIGSKIESWHKLHSEKQSEIFQKLEHLTHRVDRMESERISSRASFKERIIRKIQKSSKDYVKNLMLNLVHKYDKISGLKLREIVVEEQGLCSKSSFYRILEEIESSQDDLSVLQQGKEKIFISKMAKKQV